MEEPPEEFPEIVERLIKSGEEVARRARLMLGESSMMYGDGSLGDALFNLSPGQLEYFEQVFRQGALCAVSALIDQGALLPGDLLMHFGDPGDLGRD